MEICSIKKIIDCKHKVLCFLKKFMIKVYRKTAMPIVIEAQEILYKPG